MFDERCKDTVYLVEATSCEYHFLWRDNEMFRTLYPNLYLEWEEDNLGKCQTVGQLDKRPVVLSFRWNKLDGMRVCFYESISQVSDSLMVEEFLEIHFRAAYLNRRTNAMNFHICRDFIKGR